MAYHRQYSDPQFYHQQPSPHYYDPFSMPTPPQPRHPHQLPPITPHYSPGIPDGGYSSDSPYSQSQSPQTDDSTFLPPTDNHWENRSVSSGHVTPSRDLSLYSTGYRSTSGWSNGRDSYPDSYNRGHVHSPPARLQAPPPPPPQYSSNVAPQYSLPTLEHSGGSRRPAPASPPPPSESQPRKGLWALVDAPNNNTSNPGYSIKVLMEYAIKGSPRGRLSLQEIYAAVEERYPVFKSSWGANWRNSARHDISMDPRFVNVPRGPEEPGKGGLWMFDENAPPKPRKPRRRKTTAERRAVAQPSGTGGNDMYSPTPSSSNDGGRVRSTSRPSSLVNLSMRRRPLPELAPFGEPGRDEPPHPGPSMYHR